MQNNEKKDILEFLSAFIQKPSEGPKDTPADITECVDWLVDRLAAWGWGSYYRKWEEQKNEPNLVVIIPGSDNDNQQNSIMFNGHIDVAPVPTEETDLWKYPPYEGRITDGIIWGRGASDMKGGIASFLWAAKKAVEENGLPKKDIVLTINGGEESARPSIGIKSIINHSYTAPIVINAEPTNLAVCPAGIGWFFFSIKVEGKSTHPANRYIYLDDTVPVDEKPGIDGSEKLLLLLNELKELENSWLDRNDELFPPKSTNMTCVRIDAGGRAAAMAANAQATFVINYNPNYTSAEIMKEIKDCISSASSKDPWLSLHPPEIVFPDVDEVPYEPFKLSEEHHVVKKMCSIVREVTSSSPIVKAFACPSDANITSELGFDTLVFGPGDISFNCHGIDEYNYTEQIFNAVEIYKNLIEWRCY